MIVYPRDSQCALCRHFRGVKWLGEEETTERLICEAFPEGIPEVILLDERDHREPFPGDRGVRFEPIEAAR